MTNRPDWEAIEQTPDHVPATAYQALGYRKEYPWPSKSARASSDQVRLLLLFVTEKTTLADNLRHLRWHHFSPASVAAGDALEDVT